MQDGKSFCVNMGSNTFCHLVKSETKSSGEKVILFVTDDNAMIIVYVIFTLNLHQQIWLQFEARNLQKSCLGYVELHFL